jgi:hypothetical protein
MRPGRDADPSPLLVLRSKNRVELYIYSPQGPSWPVKRAKSKNEPRGHFWIRNSTDTETLAKYCLGHLSQNRYMDGRKGVVQTALCGS